MVESDGSEFATPLGGNTDSAEEGHKFVAKSKPAVKTGIRQLPDTVDTTGSFGFSQDIFELNLQFLIAVMLKCINMNRLPVIISQSKSYE
jgi:hypothetical protein